MTDKSEITQLLIEVSKGDQSAYDQLFPLVYDELRHIARKELARLPNGTFQRTELVHEAYLKLINQQKADFNNRTHFFAIAAKAMRQILVDHARRRQAQKRGGRHTLISFEDEEINLDQQAEYIIAIDELLVTLSKFDTRMAKIVELRFFTGMSIEETASLLEVSTSTVDREWSKAKGWLYQQLKK